MQRDHAPANRPELGAQPRARLPEHREAPQVGRKVSAGEAVAVVESVKAASDVYAPVAGEIVGANADLGGSPQNVNEDAYAAWIFRIKPSNAADAEKLLDADAYAKSAS